jgi:hypothetical protein
MAVTSADAARLVITFGNIVVLCTVDGQGRCSWPEHKACEAPGKRPIFEFCPSGFHSPIDDPERAADIYATHDLNIGIALAAADIVAVDVDQHPGRANGHLEDAALTRRLGPRGATVSDETGGGGVH